MTNLKLIIEPGRAAMLLVALGVAEILLKNRQHFLIRLGEDYKVLWSNQIF